MESEVSFTTRMNISTEPGRKHYLEAKKKEPEVAFGECSLAVCFWQ